MKISIQSLLFISILCFCLACKKDKDSNFEKINTVTGVCFTDENGTPLGKWQFPNEKAPDLFLFPNPAINLIFLEAQESLKNIWIILGDCETEDIGEDITQMSQSLSYEVEEIEAREVLLSFDSSQLTDNSLIINISGLDEAFYRMFIETENGEIFWKNFYKFSGPTGGQSLVDLLENACE